MQILTNIIFAALVLSGGCMQQMSDADIEKMKTDVWQTVKAHNIAWSVDENIEEQMKYVHTDIVSISPPFVDKLVGIEKYREGYLGWYEHATVHSFEEVNPHITIYNEAFAVVVFNIEMSFDYDDKLVDGWKGMDMMTLVKVESNWLITSDMFAQKTE